MYDYFVNNSDVNNSKKDIFFPDWQEFTITNFTLESNILNQYLKQVVVIPTNQTTFDYK